jgi:hypothetical protein
MSLRYDVYSLFTSDENLEFKNRTKFHSAGDKRVRAWDGAVLDAEVKGTCLPLAAFPWNQPLVVFPSHSLAMQGRSCV